MSWSKTKRSLLSSILLFVLTPALIGFTASLPRFGLAFINISLGVGPIQAIPTLQFEQIPSGGFDSQANWGPARKLVWVDLSDGTSSGGRGVNLSTLIADLPGVDADNTVRVISVADLVAQCAGSGSSSSRCFAGVVFHPGSALLNYSLLFPNTGLNRGFSVNTLGSLGSSGILSLQTSIELGAILQAQSSAARAIQASTTVARPFTALSRAALNSGALGFLYDFLSNTGSAVISLMPVPSVYWLAHTIATDRELGVRDALSIMGLSTRSYVLSLALRYACACAPMLLILMGVLAWGIFPTAHLSSCLLMVLLPVLALFPATLVFTSRWRKARLAGVAAAFLAFGIAAVTGQLARVGPNAALRIASSLALPGAFLGFGFAFLARSEQSDVPVSPSTWQQALPSQGADFLSLVLASTGCIALYSMLAWAVLAPSMCERRCRVAASHPTPAQDNAPILVEGFDCDGHGASSTSRPLLQLRAVGKRYPGAPTASVSSVTLACHESEVLVLLGMNGCGKTTTMAMITGRIAPTYGTVERAEGASIGWCPQHDILWADATVRETLAVYAAVKGVGAASIAAEAAEWATRAGLGDKLDALAGTLSGGQKRRLSLAAALIGDSKILLLDEPTAGVDPANRRLLWDLIVAHKRGRTVLLTTHFLDEAEALSDRVALMHEGSLRAVGTTLHLKRALPFGYNLTISGALRDGQNRLEHARALLARAHAHVPAARIVSTGPGDSAQYELVIGLPLEANPVIPTLLRSLEGDAAASGIDAVGVSSASLHDVFARLVTHADAGAGSIPSSAAAAVSVAAAAAHTAAPTPAPSHAHEAPPRIPLPVSSASASPPTLELPLAAALSMPRSASAGSVVVRVAPVDAKAAADAACTTTVKHPFETSPLRLVTGVSAWLLGLRALVSKRWLLARKDVKMSLLPYACMAIVAVIVASAFRAELPVSCPASLLAQPAMQSITSELAASARPFGPLRSLAVTAGSVLPAMLPASALVNVSNSSALLETLQEAPGSVWGAIDAPWPLAAPWPAQSSVAYDIALPLADAAAINTLHNSLANRAGLGSQSIFVSLQQIPYQISAFSSRNWDASIAVVAALLIACALVVPLASSMIVTRERVAGMKLQQRLSGVTAMQYWLSHAVWDVLSVALLAAIIAAGLAFTPAWLPGFGATFLSFFVYGLASAAWGYAMSFAAGSPAGSIALHGGIAFVIAVGCVAGVVVADPASGRLLSAIMTYIALAAHPLSALIVGVVMPGFNMVFMLCGSEATRQLAAAHALAPAWLAWNAAGRAVAIIASHAAIAFCTVLLAEYGLCRCLQQRQSRSRCNCCCSTRLHRTDVVASGIADEDIDVCAERVRVEAAYGSGQAVDAVLSASNATNSDEVVVRDARKSFWVRKAHVAAVRGVTIGLSPRSCYGHLGQNGAGKTTLLRMIAGEEPPTSGSITVHGHDLDTDLQALQRSVGVCPQFDRLYDELTAFDHLRMFAAIKGLAPGDSTDGEIRRLLAALDLTEHAHKRSSALSGGNKRKLSVAIALIGRPPVVILDEPSTGMDPAAKRKMWQLIASLRQQHTIILTTHSMEECEAVAQRIGVMVSGRLAALGSLGRLRQRFGAAFQVDAVCRTAEDATRAGHVLSEALPGSVVAEQHGRQLRLTVPRFFHGPASATVRQLDGNSLPLAVPPSAYSVPVPSRSVADIFEAVEANSAALHILVYQVSQASLEEIFLRFATPTVTV